MNGQLGFFDLLIMTAYLAGTIELRWWSQFQRPRFEARSRRRIPSNPMSATGAGPGRTAIGVEFRR